MSSSERESNKSTAAAAIRRTAILAIDYGKVRIGLALADIETALPRPLTTIERVNRNEDMRRLRELAREHAVKEIVVGLPLRLDGTRGEMAELSGHKSYVHHLAISPDGTQMISASGDRTLRIWDTIPRADREQR